MVAKNCKHHKTYRGTRRSGIIFIWSQTYAMKIVGGPFLVTRNVCVCVLVNILGRYFFFFFTPICYVEKNGLVNLKLSKFHCGSPRVGENLISGY